MGSRPQRPAYRPGGARAIEAHPAKQCDPMRTTAFHTGNDGVFQNNWSDVLCFPYTLCIKFWECCTALCAGTNYCMMYWLVVQWITCKIQKATTPHPVVYPYFFNIFFQVFGLTIFFCTIWSWYGKSTLAPYFKAYWTALLEVHYGPETTQRNVTRLSYRKYCFRKSEIFEVPLENSGLNVMANYTLPYITVAFHYFISKMKH